MPSGLATRCPACGTVFRVVLDQLRVSEGWVRCGRCSEVFDATRSLTDIETGEPRHGFADASRPADLPPAPAPFVAQAVFAPPAPTSPDNVEPPWPEHESPYALQRQAPEPEAPAGPAADEPAGRITALADDAPAAADGDPHAEPDDRPSFVVQAERAERWRRPRVRLALALVSLLGALGLVAQVGIEYRDPAAARFPALKPLLEQACAALGCTVEAARAIDGLAVESSGLVRVERSSVYRLSVSLRNRKDIELALPALDLTLTDSQGRVVSRKVLRVAELGAQQATIGAGREIALQATLQTQAAAASAPAPEAIAGYTIDLFYP